MHVHTQTQIPEAKFRYLATLSNESALASEITTLAGLAAESAAAKLIARTIGTAVNKLRSTSMCSCHA